MLSNFCILAKKHAPIKECGRILAGDASVAATLQLPWHARAVVILLDTGDAGVEHINAMAAHQLDLAKIGVMTLNLAAPAAGLDMAFLERCLDGAMQWLANHDAGCALPVGSLWTDGACRDGSSRPRRFIRVALFHHGRVNLANQAEIYRAGISHFLIDPAAAGAPDSGDIGHSGSACDVCADNASDATVALSEAAAVAQLAMQIGFWFSDHLNCIADRLDRSMCPARVTRLARKCWAISPVLDDCVQASSDTSPKVKLQAL